MAFSGVKGHLPQINSLSSCVLEDRLSNAYLFLGPAGVGKKLVALNFAKLINCQSENAASGNPCDECPSCKKINSFQHPDIFFISPDSNGTIKIDSIRECIKRSFLRPYEARYKIIIIDEAESMHDEAANALLKTLEEPQKNNIFILISANEKRLLPTVISRCRRIKFYAQGAELIKKVLIDDYKMDEQKAHFISHFSEGRFGPALAVKDTDVLRAKNALLDSFIAKRAKFKDKKEAKYALNLFSGWLRDLLLLKIVGSKAAIINIDRRQELFSQKDKYTISQLKRAIIFIKDAVFYLDRNINMRLFNNLVRIKLCSD
ncbi:MAG: DNA polymerase III subunit delta' [Candidatus Omnitrophica bacterium CG11_big_fil_rev_8_21_14_0_20_42_13]|uniref:DNA polymerase III subunit delta n=1 Tax=Candidatus Ghiorseimicrobium undicola TaxID=1974746 RepID=A0A2H0LW30_9BACT|nr:MAG: DNA polymerase III subunit delta' [Candidatus Omnitrophica bacterium CG11_big_fil_rev_8_21_14_0_20_42_13]